MHSKVLHQLCIVTGLAIASSGCSVAVSGNKSINNELHSPVAETTIQGELSFTTWNVEHLAYPISQGCKPRTSEELAKLQAYASSLDADVVGLQEVASVEAVAQLFPTSEWQLFVSARPDSEPYTCRRSGFTSTQQKVAIAVRKGIDVVNVSTLDEFGLGLRGLRHGLELQIDTPLGPVNVLNVHMKSGCFVDNYARADSEACSIFKQQAPILDAWVEKQEVSKQPYVLMGDFNHRLSAPYNQLNRDLITNSNGTASTLVNTTKDTLGCHPYYPALIDHILIGGQAMQTLDKTISVHTFDDMQVENMLSDHCAVSLNLSAKALPITNSVKWQTTSKEYRYLTTSIYTQASKTLRSMTLPSDAWTVVMDIDETVLDNSQYQVRLDTTGSHYTSASWNAWVAEENAGLVPGVADFMSTVIELGGTLSLVTNRNRALDQHTWSNMQALGLPIGTNNTCLMGRTKEDVSAINDTTIINDKDLRRQQVQNGSASCYQPGSERKRIVSSQSIIMQVGDNIEDFAQTTQHDADVNALIQSSGDTLILLPNPMYGSW
ncbi:HAD family acid phosphatase [Alteromonas facilis]|uniref:HAD family acid phosphatase n=1 Tax=Alteromonas facilis TaxID=2048004 RepID=UPI000C294CA4|nr:HAD family acid phosphatase [Alteromonas facilis]